MIVYTRGIYTSYNLRKVWDLSHFDEIRIVTGNERNNIMNISECNLANNLTFLSAFYENNHFAILDINTIGFLRGLMDDLVTEMSQGKNVYNVTEYYNKNERDTSLYEKYSIDVWLERQLKLNAKARIDVLNFIWNFVTHDKETDSFRVIEHQFTTGYCYHFALILQKMFGGKIVCHKGHRHILWQDEKVLYDVRGIYTYYNPWEIVPVSELGDEIEDYFHR